MTDPTHGGATRVGTVERATSESSIVCTVDLDGTGQADIDTGLPFFDHIHRFMPAMMLREGWRVETVPVTHRERRGGASKYGVLTRALVGVPDLLGAAWLIRRAEPSHHQVFDAGQERASLEVRIEGEGIVQEAP